MSQDGVLDPSSAYRGSTDVDVQKCKDDKVDLSAMGLTRACDYTRTIK